MKKTISLIGLLALLSLSSVSHAMPVIDIEAAIGAWMHTPSGDLSYRSEDVDDNLIINDDLNYDTETQIYGRALIHLPIEPTLYLIAAPMTFEGTNSDKQFDWGDITISPDYEFYSKLTLNLYDVTLYYSLPLLNLATLGTLNIDLGLDARFMDVEVLISQVQIGNIDSQSITLVVPMIYAAAQLKPGDRWSIEAEARGISYAGNSIYSLIARLEVKIFGPTFAAGGYRHEVINMDEQDVRAEISFGGPFVEAGIQF